MPIRFIILLAALALAAAPACAEEPAPRLPLDVLLETPISTAAKYDQQLASVAASVTVITAEEIERYGWTTLDEAIQSVRGTYLTNDRNYTYFGIRGIGRPTDYNSRVLILVDGHTMNGEVWSEGATTGALALDIGLVKKIEIVRGPASALYGSHAMLAVINIITKDFDAREGLSVAATAGSRGKRTLSIRSGRELASGMRLTSSAHWSRIEGNDLYYPEFDEPGLSDGIARDLDYEELFNAALAVEKGGLRASLSTRWRTKGIPNASYGTVFNADSNTVERRDTAVVSYHRPAGRGKELELRGYWDRVLSIGNWVYDSLGVTHSADQRLGGEATFHWDIRANQRLTAGMEVTDHPRADYRYVVGDYRIDVSQPFDESSYYVQHEYHPTARLGFVTGVRHDRSSRTPSSTNPRAAVLFQPNRLTTFKLLYGTAFLAPNVYQSFFSDPETPWKVNPSLGPETIRTFELVCERRVSPQVLVVGTVYRIDAESLIQAEIDPADAVYWYRNRGRLRSTGAGVDVDWRRPDGLWTHFSYATQHAEGDDGELDNSPDHLLKAGLSTSPWKPMHVGLEALYESGRLTRSGGKTGAVFLLNGVVSRQIAPRIRASLSVRNLLDADYALPVGAELRPDTVAQDGRTFTFALSYARTDR